jgi:hypothetical protein
MQGVGKIQFISNIRNVDYKDYKATIVLDDYERDVRSLQ